MSPTPIAYKDGDFRKLRDAILREIEDRRRPVSGVEPTKEELEARKEEHRKTRITYWQKVAQAAQSLVAEFEARALRAEAKSLRSMKLVRRIRDDLESGRLVQADPDEVILAELTAALGPPSKRRDEIDDVSVE